MILDKDFIGREFPQNCGDSLLVLSETNKRSNDGHILFNCYSLKFNNYILGDKRGIIKGYIRNPKIEEFWTNSLHFQNCGDSLKIIRKTNLKKNNKPKESFLYECEFIKYSFKVFATKTEINKGKVNNPQIEIEEFINKIWPQNCGDSLRIIEKSNVQDKCQRFLFKCKFIGYEKTYLRTKDAIINGLVSNWENLEYSSEEKELRDYISFIYNKEIIKDDYSVLKDREIDIYLPELKIGFEFNGIYWHSQKFKDKNYHLNKTKDALKNGIILYHIWEDEWLGEKDKIKQWLKDILLQRKSFIYKGVIDKEGITSKYLKEPELIKRQNQMCWNCGYNL